MNEIVYRCKWWINKRCTQNCGNRDAKYEDWKTNKVRECTKVNEIYRWVKCIKEKDNYIMVIDD